MIIASTLLIVTGVSVFIGTAIGRLVCWQNKARRYWKRGDPHEPE